MDLEQYVYAGVNPFMIGIFYVSGAFSFTQSPRRFALSSTAVI
jgi:hypothetical protein